MAIKDNIEKCIAEDVESLGYEIEYIEVVKEGKDNFVRIVIDKPEASLTTEDCEVVSRKIEDKIDSLVKLEDGYILEVSSPGLERQLKNIKLYKKYTGKEILVKLYKKINESKELQGNLVEVKDDESIVLDVEGQQISLKIADIASANTIYKF
ncbi:MAG: ribosome maturation factor RimP [Clostridia bacterium]|nr:ribosome maturation factor RimP [Clostridia bacterium]